MITGGSSKIAKILKLELESNKHIVHLSTRNPDCRNYFDLLDTNFDLNLKEFDLIIHLALDKSKLDSFNRYLNIQGTFRLAKQTIESSTARFLLISTESVNIPKSNYAQTKLATEEALSGLPVCIFRVATIIDTEIKVGIMEYLNSSPVKFRNTYFLPSFVKNKNLFKISRISELISIIEMLTKSHSRDFLLCEPNENLYSLEQLLLINNKSRIIYIPVNLFFFHRLMLFFGFFNSRFRLISDSILIYE